VTYRRVLDWIYCTLYTQLGSTGNTSTALFLIYTLYSLPLHTHYDSQSSLVISWQRIYKNLSLQITHEVLFSQPNSFLAIILQLPIPKTRLDSIQFPCSQAHILEVWRLGRRLTLLSCTLLYNNFARTTQKTQPLYCWEGVFTAPLHSNGICSIVACVFVAAGMCLLSRCLVLNDYSDFTIPAFGRHVTIIFHYFAEYTIA
jgi:hypothetical protein